MRTDQLIAQAAKQAAANSAAQRPGNSPSRVELAAAEMMSVPLAPRVDGADAPLEPGQNPNVVQGERSAQQAAPRTLASMSERPGSAAPSQPAMKSEPAQTHRPAAEAAAKAASAAPTLDGGSPNESAGPVTHSNWHESVPVGNRKVATKGLIFIFGFLGLFFAWAVLFPISSAVVASGNIVSAGANKLIQHPSGGVVRQIKVLDGQSVEAGDVILLLDPSAARAEFSRLSARQRLLEAQRTRLDSEQGENAFDNKIAVSGVSLRGTQVAGSAQQTEAEADAADLMSEQRREFEAGRKRLKSEIDAATSQIESLKDERSGSEAQLAGARKLLAFTNAEIGKVEPLVNEGYLPKTRLWDLEKKRLEQVTSVTNLESNIDSTGQKVSEAEARLAQLIQADQEKRSEERTRVIAELAEIRDSIAAAKVAMTSTELKAPVAGVLTKMTANTEGGVIKPGDTIAEIVPANSGLVTEFRVPLEKIKAVSVGQTARVVLSAFNRRTYDPIEGEVIYVSADSQMDNVTGESYFLARAKLKADPEKNNGLSEIQAGMTTEVYALSEPRVFLSYVAQPIFDSFSKAFREIN